MNQSCASRSMGGALLLAALALLSSLPAQAAEDVRGAAPQRGRALVFVFRIDRQPQAAQVSVLVNAELVGELANGTFAVASVDPGTTYLRIGDRVLSTLSFVAAANQRYYVWVDAITGPPLVRTEVNLVGEADGQRALAQSRFVGVAPAAPVAAPPVTAPPVTAPPRAAPPADRVAPAAPAPTRDTAVPAEPERDRHFAIIVSAGTFKLADDGQVVGGLASTYDTTSSSVWGVEAEWRGKTGFAFGAEIFSYKNDLAAGGTVSNAQQDVLAIMANGKYYFDVTSRIHPFVGAGIGVAKTDYSGALTGDATGPVYQGFAGVEFRFKPVGLYLQYKYFSGKTGDSGSKVKVGGSGLLAGVSISF
jgi:hypothetical protein